MNARGPDPHLTDAELFALAAPPSGEPEPLPQHLARCEACARSLVEWREAVCELGREQARRIDERPAEDWDAAREATMAAVRSAGRHRSASAVRWIAGIAAALLLVALAMPARRGGTAPAGPDAPQAASSMSPADRADDALLRDAEYMAQGGDDNFSLIGEDGVEDSSPVVEERL